MKRYLLSALLVSACGGSPAESIAGPEPKATLSGVVKNANGASIEGAVVNVGSASATTDVYGHFELQNLPVGYATIVASAPRFDASSKTVNLSAGANAHDVVLTLRTIFSYANVQAYLPPEIAEYKAAVVFLPGLMDPSTGLPLDSRGLVRGTAEPACSIWCLPQEKAEVRTRALALVGGNVALVGASTLTDNAGSYQTLLAALSAIATESLHPELANIPILLVGHSMGGCTAYGFTRIHGARVAGFMTMKGGCHNLGPAAEAAGVPGYFLIGALDADYRRQNITAAFEAGRAGGAPWAISIDPLHHNPIADMEMLFDWLDAVLAARLPATKGASLRAVTQTDGWLGDRTTGAIATYSCFDSNRSSASWLPSEETAVNWQRMFGGTAMTNTC